MAITSEFYFPSSDGKTLIHVNQWTPTERGITGVVQIAHGVAEYGGRYAPFARYLCAHGYVVVANDHLGHGQSVIEGRPMVYLGEEDGWRHVVDDMEELRRRVSRVFPGKPYDLCALAVLSVGLIALPILISAYAGRNRPDLSMLTQCRQALRHMALEKAKFRAALTTPGMALAYTLFLLFGVQYFFYLL